MKLRHIYKAACNLNGVFASFSHLSAVNFGHPIFGRTVNSIEHDDQIWGHHFFNALTYDPEQPIFLLFYRFVPNNIKNKN